MVSNKGAGSVGGEKGAHRLGVHRPIVHIAIAVVGDVEDHELGLGRRLFAQLGKLAHLRHGPFAFFGGDEEEHRLSASRLCRLGERRLRLEQRRLLLWRASLSHHAEAALFVAAHVDHTGGGCHGKLAPSGSAETAERPDALITSPVAPSISTRVGMPFTSNMLDSASLRVSPCGIASQGISPKYSPKDAVVRSEEQKMISSCLPSARTLLYVLTSSGVNALQGGHQCAEKYRPITLPGPLISSIETSSCWERKSLPSASHKVGGFHGNAAPDGSCMTAERPSRVMSSPVLPSTMTSVGMPCTLYFLEREAFRSRASNGSASHGCSA
mmetsp:Transcript_9530/g.31680  ORF Transcript_9530/g.31680 Transcript_9530/m.31680 type:complete len:327 (+) Transcript_9530:178-1158(+)